MSLFYTEEFIIQTPEVCAAASEAQSASQDVQPAEPAQSISNDEITWTIDRTPDLTYSPTGIDEPIIIYDDFEHINNFRYFNQPLPEAIPYNFSKKNIQIQISNLEISEEDKNCCICMEIRDEKDICSLNCNHKFCGLCIEICIKKSEFNCSLCRGNVTNITTQNNEIKEKLNKYCI